MDDSPTVIAVVRAILQGAGYEVEALGSFIALPQLLCDHCPDLILLDLEMPAMDGQAMGHFIRRYQDRPIPILIYSSRPLEELRAAAADLGAAGYLSKSRRDPGFLVEGVRAALGGGALTS
ncbi:MAG: response regulator [Myxococcales bacterium]|nr:response regulator [Myxococcales bacterium]